VNPTWTLPTPLHVTVVESGHRTVDCELAQPVDLGIDDAGKGDTGHRPDAAARAVTPHQESGRHPIPPLRALDVRRHGRVVLTDAGDLVAATDTGA
jgi:hypothetical protein